MRRAIPGAALVSLVLLSALAAADKEDKAGAKKEKENPLVGTWVIVSGEEGGKPAPPEKYKGATVRITATTMTSTGADKKEFYAATYKLNRSTTPWSVTMTSTAPAKGEVSEGIVELRGDTLKICYALPGAEKPTAFKTREKQHLFVLKRDKKGG